MSAHRPFDLVLFDLDGTLLETAPGIRDAVNDMLAQLGLAPVSLAQVEAWIGHGSAALVAQALTSSCGAHRNAALSGQPLAFAMAHFDAAYARRCGTGSRPYPQVRELLAAFGERGVRRAVVTNKEGRFATSILRHHGLDQLLDHVICGDTVPARKPDPAGVLDCMRRFGAAASRTLFVGDSAIDVATARNAGVAVWAMSHGYNRGVPIAEWRPDRVLDTFDALLETAKA